MWRSWVITYGNMPQEKVKDEEGKDWLGIIFVGDLRLMQTL